MDISILKNGIIGGINATLYNLSQKKLIKISRNSDGVYVNRAGSKTGRLSKLEQFFLNYVKDGALHSSFFAKSTKATVVKMLAPNLEKLVNLHLIPSKKLKRFRWMIYIFAILMVLSVGVTKTKFGISNEKPVGILILIQFGAIIALYFVIQPQSNRITRLGRQLLNKMKIRIEWVLSESDLKMNPNTEDVLFAVAIWGVAPLMSTYLANGLYDLSLLDKASSIKIGSSINSNACSGCSGATTATGANNSSACSGGGGCGGCGGCGG
ncbi:MAG: DUF2207 domain-containing protein [Bacteroidales bacterium]|nr:DUF2207 domain-containing protein [Bacteroidales bacterium]